MLNNFLRFRRFVIVSKTLFTRHFLFFPTSELIQGMQIENYIIFIPMKQNNFKQLCHKWASLFFWLPNSLTRYFLVIIYISLATFTSKWYFLWGVHSPTLDLYFMPHEIFIADVKSLLSSTFHQAALNYGSVLNIFKKTAYYRKL